MIVDQCCVFGKKRELVLRTLAAPADSGVLSEKNAFEDIEFEDIEFEDIEFEDIEFELPDRL